MNIIKTIFVAIGFIALITCAIIFQQHSLQIISWIKNLGWIAPVLFVFFYALATILFLPTMVLTLAGGAVFGPVLGILVNLFGASLGAALSFLITRHLVCDWFSAHCGPKLNKLIHGVDNKGWIFVAFLRLFPIIPFNLVNYGLGVTGIRFRVYVLTTVIFLIPAEIIYTYFGYAGMDVLTSPNHFYKSGGIILLAIALCFLLCMRLVNRYGTSAVLKNSHQT